jgi:hypothetical protein
VTPNDQQGGLVSAIVKAAAHPVQTAQKVAGEVRVARAHLKGEGLTLARRIKPLHEFAASTDLQQRNGEGPRPTRYGVKMLDGQKRIFFSDGSLRRLTGTKPGKAGRKAQKRKRHAARTQTL